MVAGPTAFICRGCVDMCIDVFSEKDRQWRDQTVARLLTLRGDWRSKLLALVAKACSIG